MRLRVGPGLERDADRRRARRQRLALGEPTLERDHDRALRRRRSFVVENDPLVLGEALAPPQRHQMPVPASSGADMDAALHFPSAAPSAGALVLAGLDRARAGQAADRRKALGDQRMARQAGFLDVLEHVARAPADERIDLDPLSFRFEQRQARARRALEALPAGYPRVEPFHRLGEGRPCGSRSSGPDRWRTGISPGLRPPEPRRPERPRSRS